MDTTLDRANKTARRLVKKAWPAAPERYLQLRIAGYGLLRGRIPQGPSDRLELRRKRFEKAYSSGRWTSTGESLSGDGSSLSATEQLRQRLPGVLRDLGVRTLVDMPCGDWNWMAPLDSQLNLEKYIGADLLPSLVEQNRRRFGDVRHEFLVLDLCVDPLPDGDVLLCRDALIHFSYADVWRALENIARSNIGYLATTTFAATPRNRDIATGVHWRRLNLMAPPFSFPPALVDVAEGYDGPDKMLSIWPLDVVRDVLATRP